MAAVGTARLALLGAAVFASFAMVHSDESCDIEIENTLKTLLTPQRSPSMQLQALRKDMLRRFQEALDADAGSKRSLSSLARWDNLPAKRNLEALARAGLVRTLPAADDDDDDLGNKRSDAEKQARPGFQINDAKRGIQSLARNGELHSKKQVEEALEELYDKRNIASLARNFNFPGKRYLGALVRNGDWQMGRSRRSKRQAFLDDGGEYPSPVYQNQNVDDYEEMMRALTGTYPNTEKRFLGSVARSGWFLPSSRYQSLEKRHIGALARLGWLPTLRNVRRFNRSGRSTSSDDCRETAADGQAEDDSVAEDSLPLEDKRFLLQPAVDRILLRKIFMHPRSHPLVSGMS